METWIFSVGISSQKQGENDTRPVTGFIYNSVKNSVHTGI